MSGAGESSRGTSKCLTAAAADPLFLPVKKAERHKQSAAGSSRGDAAAPEETPAPTKPAKTATTAAAESQGRSACNRLRSQAFKSGSFSRNSSVRQRARKGPRLCSQPKT